METQAQIHNTAERKIDFVCDEELDALITALEERWTAERNQANAA